MTELFSSAVSVDRSPAPTAMAFISDQETEDLVRRALGDLGIEDADFTRGTSRRRSRRSAGENPRAF